MIKLYSTNNKNIRVTIKEAILTGQAPDKGLYMPERYPVFNKDRINQFRDMDYYQIAHSIIREYTEGFISDTVLESLCKDAYNFDVPLEKVYRNVYVMRLDRGPTCSFKDFAARMMARLMGHFIKGQDKELVILTATSGDTGSAVANAFHNVPNIKIVVLFPREEVSVRQRKQMTTLGGNVQIISIDGKFDDCQAMVKQAFADETLSDIWLSSANSINIARLIPQSVYYFYAYSRIAESEEDIIFSVPSGNFGDMMGCVFAKRMGLPLNRLLVITNSNDEVPNFLKTGEYNKIVPSKVCISNAMNVGHPSNLARLIDVYNGTMDETGNITKKPDMELLNNDIWSMSVNDGFTRAAIISAWKEYELLLEPHGAVSWYGLQQYIKNKIAKVSCPMVSLETAHPAKFPDEIMRLLDFEPEAPDGIKQLENLEEKYDSLTKDYDNFKDYLMEMY